MRVLVACEESQTVCKAFRAIGHEAYSNDIQDCSGGHPEWHLQMDVFEAIALGNWDLMIAHPPCTDLSGAGAQFFQAKKADGRQARAIEFVNKIYAADIPLIAIENPRGALGSTWKKSDQEIHPFQFGDPYKKRTALWLKGLPKLEPTKIVEPIGHWVHSRHAASTKLKSMHSNKKMRSKFFPGIAQAMAEQWGGINVPA